MNKDDVDPTKPVPNESTTLTLKGQYPRRMARDPGSLVLGPWSVWIVLSNPCPWVATSLNNECGSIAMEPNRVASLGGRWVLIRL